MGEGEQAAVAEAAYIESIPGMSERIEEAKETPIEECEPFEW